MSSSTITRGSYKAKLVRDYALIFPKIDQELQSYEVEAPKHPLRRRFLRDFNAEMFIPSYQRWCPKGPTILETKTQLEEAKEAGKDVMIFPLSSEEGVPWAYVCDHPEFPYVGLRANKLKNKDQYHFLPCCFRKAQKDNPHSLRYQYEQVEAPEETSSERGRPHIFLTQKIFRPSSYAILPEDVYRFLNAMNPNTDTLPLQKGRFPFVRQAGIRSVNSVLDVLIRTVLDYYDDIDEKKDESGKEIISQTEMKRKYKTLISSKLSILEEIFDNYDTFPETRKFEFITNVRKALVNLVPSNISAQNAFSFEINALQEQLLKEADYLDPKVVWRLLEEAFHVNIVLFRRTLDKPNGVLAAPAFLQEYLQYKRSRKESKDRFTIFLFETIGAERDRLDYPQVEIIKQFVFQTNDTGELTTNVFSWFKAPKDEDFLERIHSAFDQIYGWDGKSAWSIPNIFGSKPQGQCADFYGKIRLLQFSDDICILTEPLPPLDKSDLKENAEARCQLKPIPLEKALNFLRMEGLSEGKDFRAVIINEKLVGYQCWKQTKNKDKPLVRFYIPIVTEQRAKVKGAEESSIIRSSQGPSFISRESLMETFIQLSRFARYLIEYVLWKFSQWHQKNAGNLQDSKYLSRFAREGFRVIEGHKYPSTIPRRFDPKLSGVVSGSGTIIVPSNDVRNRMIYSLQLRLNQNVEEVVGYHTRTFIKNYYQDISDFSLQPANVILSGTEMVLSWIDSKIPHYELFDRIKYAPCQDEELELQEEVENRKEEEKVECKALEARGFVIDPYFIKLQTLDDKIYIVQHAKSLEQALYISEIWLTRGYNAGYSSEGILSTKTPFRFIAYNGPLDMTVENINGNSPRHTVLQYRFKDEIYTMVLLPFSGRM
jgi:hypothetical protein